MWKLLKWLGFGALAYLVFAMIFTSPETGEVGRDDFVDRVIARTDMLKDPRGNDPLAGMLAVGTVDSYLSANCLRTAALMLKSAGDPPDTALCRRSLRYIRAASTLDTLDSTTGQLLAYLLWRMGDREAAIMAAGRATERLTPADTTVAMAWLGGLYLEAGRTDSALAAFRRQLSLDPESELYYNDTRYYLARSGLSADSVEAVLSLSREHDGLFDRLERTWTGAITWPRRKIAGMF